MARYFFHIMDDKAVLDTVGVEIATLDTVRKEAIRAAGQIISDGEYSWNGHAWQMTVADEADRIVFSVSFSVDRHGF